MWPHRLLRRLLLQLSLGLAQALRVGPAASLAQFVLDRTSVQLHSAKLQSLRSGRALPQGLLQIYVEVEATIDTPPIGGGQSGPASFTVSSADINVEFEGEDDAPALVARNTGFVYQCVLNHHGSLEKVTIPAAPDVVLVRADFERRWAPPVLG